MANTTILSLEMKALNAKKTLNRWILTKIHLQMKIMRIIQALREIKYQISQKNLKINSKLHRETMLAYKINKKNKRKINWKMTTNHKISKIFTQPSKLNF